MLLLKYTYLNPIHDIFRAFSLKEELLALSTYANDILLLHIIGGQSALRVLQCVLFDEIVIVKWQMCCNV